MASILSTTDKTPRGQVAIIIAALQHKDGYTAQELLDAAGGITKHNSYSLGLIAERFGFSFKMIPGSEYEDGLSRYFFSPKAKAAKPATRKAPAKAKAKAPTKAAAFKMQRPAKKASRKAA